MVFITAEIGTSWMGDYHTLYKIMKACKDAGFDAVKLQAFNKSHLKSKYWRIDNAVTHYNVNEIDSIAKLAGIKWYCTPCYVEAVDFLAPYVDMWKIMYKDRNNLELINKVLDYEQTTLISTDEPNKYGALHKKAHSMYCISKYPTPKEEIDLKKMKEYDGYSCHTPEITHIMLAAGLGLKFLEVHVTPDKTDPLVVDNNVAFDLNELHSLIERVRIGQNWNNLTG
jgi:sialic acid synthase SpsE